MQRIIKTETFYVAPSHKLLDRIYELGDVQERRTSVKATVTDWMVHCCSNDFDELIGQLYVLYPKHQVEELWGCTYQQGDFAQTHNHSGFDLSFVWFVDTCPNCTPLVFPDPEHPWMPPLRVFTPHRGNLHIFDGNDIHYVPPHTCNHDRVVMSGNLSLLNNEGLHYN